MRPRNRAGRLTQTQIAEFYRRIDAIRGGHWQQEQETNLAADNFRAIIAGADQVEIEASRRSIEHALHSLTVLACKKVGEVTRELAAREAELFEVAPSVTAAGHLPYNGGI